MRPESSAKGLSGAAKTVLKALLPPIVIRILKPAYFRILGERPEWEYLPDGWSTQDPAIRGWNEESVIKTDMARWQTFLDSIADGRPLALGHESSSHVPYSVESTSSVQAHNTHIAFAYSIALASRNKDHLSFLDWGGGIGHYFALAREVIPDVEVEYHCRDLPMLAGQGRRLFPEAQFYDDDDPCFSRTYDFVMASGSLQFAEDWRLALQRLGKATGEYLFVTRLPVIHRSKDYVAVQRAYEFGYNTEFMSWFLNRGDFLECASSCGFSLVREYLIAEAKNVHLAPEQGEFRGFLFRSKMTT